MLHTSPGYIGFRKQLEILIFAAFQEEVEEAAFFSGYPQNLDPPFGLSRVFAHRRKVRE